MNKRYYTCGVPSAHCCGTTLAMSARMGGPHGIKAHGTREEAFRCKAAYLKSQGYKQIGSREFSPPDGGPVVMLAKKSHFGGVLRAGKAGEGGGKPTRWMPNDHTGHLIADT